MEIVFKKKSTKIALPDKKISKICECANWRPSEGRAPFGRASVGTDKPGSDFGIVSSTIELV